MRTPEERRLEDLLRPVAQGCAFEKLLDFYKDVVATAGDAGRRALCRVDRFYLLTCELSRPDAMDPWLYARCREVEANPDGYLDLWAREHYKSTIITFAGAIQEVLIDPNITIAIFSHTAPIAKKFMRQIKEELERNLSIQALFPDILWAHPQRDSPRWSIETGIVVKRTSNAKEGTIEAWGLVDGQPTSAHYKLRIYDDVVTDKSVTTPEQVEKTTNSWALSDNLGARGEDGLMRAWHVGTRYSFADTYQFILDKGLLKARIYPATHDGTFDGDPVFLSKEAWALKQKMPLAIVAAQQLQNPAAGTQAMFQKEWLKFADVRPGTLTVWIMVDPASSKKKGSDYTAMVVLGMDAGGNLYLLDGYRHKMGLRERWVKMRDLRKRWMREPGVQSVRVGYERFGLTDGLEYFEEQMRIEKESFEVLELAWPNEGPGSKNDRVQRLEPAFRMGKIFLAAAITRTDESGKTVPAETKAQEQMRATGQEHRIFKPMKKIDPNTGATYSLNKVLLDEYLLFPFSQTKDFIDAFSRIYDMEPRPPVIVDESALEPEVFADGA